MGSAASNANPNDPSVILSERQKIESLIHSAHNISQEFRKNNKRSHEHEHINDMLLASFFKVCARPEHHETVLLLLESGIDVKSTDKEGNSGLHYACQSRSLKTIELLLSRGADIDLKCRNGNTPLHYASAKGLKEFVQKFLEEEPNRLYILNRKGRSMFHFACSSGESELAVYFLDLGYDINIPGGSARKITFQLI
jgi:ankyrin repeat protein